MQAPDLRELISTRRARVGVLGLGHAGLPLAGVFARAGFQVLGLDTDAEKVAALSAGRCVHDHLERCVRELLQSGRFEASVDHERLGSLDALVICVPTPLGRQREPDLSFVEEAAEAVARSLRPGQLVVLSSTTFPGTTREVVGERLARSGLRAGEDYLLAYSPEREDPGRTEHASQVVPRVVGGTCELSGELAHLLFDAAYETVHRAPSAEVAESAKLLENVFRAVNIALVNELKLILDGLGLDVWEVIEAAATKPYGYMRFDPGPGLGGHCIPIDPWYLSWVARRAGRPTRFVELAGEINRAMPEVVVHKTQLALDARGRALSRSRVLVLGLAYKPDVADTRESPALRLIERFDELGAHVAYSDPHVPQPPAPTRAAALELQSLDLTPEILRSQDAVVVATDHAAFDWDLIAEHAPLLIDPRGRLRHTLQGDPRYIPA